MSEELRPCPFCGGTKICTEKGINLNYCDNCSAESNVEHWNNRPIEDALNRRIAELEAQQRWISVGERLPDTNANVMVNASNEQLIGSYHSKHGIWYIPSVDRPKVSHWMPLPNLPEVNNE